MKVPANRIDEYMIDGKILVVPELALLTAYGDDSDNGILFLDHDSINWPDPATPIRTGFPQPNSSVFAAL
jgi:hypothetical protein